MDTKTTPPATQTGGTDETPTMSGPLDKWWLIAIGAITVTLWQFPYGQRALYPFTLFCTYAHEMGHGLGALLVGGHFDSLVINWDGSGVARSSGVGSALGRAFVSAGGLVGPSTAGFSLLLLSRLKHPRLWLSVVAGLLLLSVALWARSIAAWLIIVPTAAVSLWIARKSVTLASFALQLMAVQLCLSIFRDVNYMFSDGARVNGQLMPSDTQQMAEALFLPYWIWGLFTALWSIALLGLGLYLVFRKEKLAAQPSAASPRPRST